MTTLRFFFFIPLVVSLTALQVVACGGATADSPDGGDAGQGLTPDSSSAGDGGTLLLQAFGGAAGSVAAQIPLLEPGAGQEATCGAPLVTGACRFTRCSLGGIGSPGGGYGNFGPISASVGTTTVALTYDGTGYPTVDFPPSVALGAGGIMEFRGGDGVLVPAFDVAAIIPGLAVLTSPVPATTGGAATIDTTQDLTVTWRPISIGQIKFGLDGGTQSVGGVAITVACTFDGTSGSGVVPRAFLSSLKQMSGTSTTYATVSSEIDATTVVGGLTIVTQSSQNTTVGGREFQVTLQ